MQLEKIKTLIENSKARVAALVEAGAEGDGSDAPVPYDPQAEIDGAAVMQMISALEERLEWGNSMLNNGE